MLNFLYNTLLKNIPVNSGPVNSGPVSTEAIGASVSQSSFNWYNFFSLCLIIITLAFIILFIERACEVSILKNKLYNQKIELEKAKEHIKCMEEKNRKE